MIGSKLLILVNKIPNISKTKQICNRCVMDTSTRFISFDEKGNCNFCNAYIENFKIAKQKNNQIEKLISEIKRGSKNKKYDCIVGLSGGVDSSMVLYDVVKRGLKPLAVHMDNGWNSELAQANIENLVKKLKVDLYTFVIDWNEYRTILKSMIDSDVLDLEILYDNAMFSVNYQQAHKYGIKYILSGYNFTTEGISIPEDWCWFKYDSKNIKAFYRLAGKKRLKSFPTFGVLKYIYSKLIGIKWIPYLDYIKYDKEIAIEILKKNCSYKSYSHKHYESIFTRFYQGYILPNKFKIDKRKAHFSSLIMSEQMTRSKALSLLKNSPYPSNELLNEDYKYICKKMKMSQKEFQKYLSRKPNSHINFPSELNLWNAFIFLTKFCKKILKKIR